MRSGAIRSPDGGEGRYPTNISPIIETPLTRLLRNRAEEGRWRARQRSRNNARRWKRTIEESTRLIRTLTRY